MDSKKATKAQTQQFVEVAVEAPIPTTLTYQLPEELRALIGPGDTVKAPLGKRMVRGVVIRTTEAAPSFQTKPVSQTEDSWPSFTPTFLQWIQWMSRYYSHPIGKIAGMVYPPLKKHSKRGSKRQVIPTCEPLEKPQLTDEQSSALKDIEKSQSFRVHLIHGVTGSGKTEIYLQAIESVISKGKSALVLVPEIALTPQLLTRFSARFPDQVAVLHSHLTDREKTDQWWRVIDQKANVLIGARSALFCPINNLGMIVIDEEHESSFKQDEQLRYHARDAAVVRAKMTDCPILLGSATPSLESWSNVESGKYHLIQLKNRVASRSLPEVNIVDLKTLKQQRKELSAKEKHSNLPFWLSDTLYEKIEEALSNDQQAAVF